MGCIYYHKNRITGAMYIGQSVSEPSNIIGRRWCKNGKGYKSSSLFWNAIQTYGWDNFEHGFLEVNVPKELLAEKEKYYIKLYHTCNQDPLYIDGYNLTFGGETSCISWTAEEDEWLKNNYLSFKPINMLITAFLLNFPNTCHTKLAIRARLKTLRLVKTPNFWTDEDIHKLKENYPTKSMDYLCKLFPNRSRDSIMSKAKSLGIKRTWIEEQKYSKEEDDLLRKYYTKYGATYCMKLLPKRSFESIRSRAKHLHLKVKCQTDAIDIDEFKDLYVSHSIKDIAAYFNVTCNVVSNLARRLNLKRDPSTIVHNIQKYKFYCIELDKVFDSRAEIAQYFGISLSTSKNIYRYCTNMTKTFQNYHWKYVYYKREEK